MLLLCGPAQSEAGQWQVPAEPVVVLPPARNTHDIKSCAPLEPERSQMPHSPFARRLHSGAQQEVGVEEEVTQAAFTVASIHHEAIAHQLTPLSGRIHPGICGFGQGAFMFMLQS